MNKGKTLLNWEIPEFHKHQRSKRWYIAAALVGAALFLYAALTANFLFAVIIVVCAIILVIRDKKEPEMLDMSLCEGGADVGDKFYSYGLFQNFWLYYDPETSKSLFLEFKNKARPRLRVPLADANPLRVREILLVYLPEDVDKENEPLSEQLSRLLKL